MTIKSKQLFILIGNPQTGKTALQKLLIEKLNGEVFSRLPVNRRFDILHPEIKRKYRDVSFSNRSYQEKEEYESVEDYFANHFNPADISFVSSHLRIDDINQILIHGKRQFYNVTGVFWSNSIEIDRDANSEISALNWDERLVIENPLVEEERINSNLNTIADSIVSFIANRTSVS